MTSRLSGSLMMEVPSSLLITYGSGASTSYSPSNLSLKCLFFGIFFADFRDRKASVLGTGRHISGCDMSLGSLFGSLFRLM